MRGQNFLADFHNYAQMVALEQWNLVWLYMYCRSV